MTDNILIKLLLVIYVAEIFHSPVVRCITLILISSGIKTLYKRFPIMSMHSHTHIKANVIGNQITCPRLWGVGREEARLPGEHSREHGENLQYSAITSYGVPYNVTTCFSISKLCTSGVSDEGQPHEVRGWRSPVGTRGHT